MTSDTQPQTVPLLEPAVLTIFGITGDLARRKLLPALYYLAHQNILPESFRIVGLSRRGTTVADVLEVMRSSVNADGKRCSGETLDRLSKIITIVDMDITVPSEYERLKHELDAVEDSVGTCMHRLFYLAIPSTLFESVVERIGASDLNMGCQHGKAESRLLIEKPFGYDLESAQELIKALHHSFAEDQIYRIDHYLAKETVQNILTFRFSNPLFSGSWNRRHISHIMITASESIGVEGRVAFYESIGAMRDLIQSHLMQILTLITIDKPADWSYESVHQAKESLLRSIVSPSPDRMSEDTVRGQYETYAGEINNLNSQTETYAALRLSIDNETWQGVPMYIRTGKQLAQKLTEVVIVFQDDEEPGDTNYLKIRVQPNEGIVLDLHIKKPGFTTETNQVPMDFCYAEEFGENTSSDYQRVFVDALRGDKTLFATSEEVLQSWRIVDPVLQAWQADQVPLRTYRNGGWGPRAADKMLREVSGRWQNDDQHVCAAHPRGV